MVGVAVQCMEEESFLLMSHQPPSFSSFSPQTVCWKRGGKVCAHTSGWTDCFSQFFLRGSLVFCFPEEHPPLSRASLC